MKVLFLSFLNGKGGSLLIMLTIDNLDSVHKLST